MKKYLACFLVLATTITMAWFIDGLLGVKFTNYNLFQEYGHKLSYVVFGLIMTIVATKHPAKKQIIYLLVIAAIAVIIDRLLGISYLEYDIFQRLTHKVIYMVCGGMTINLLWLLHIDNKIEVENTLLDDSEQA